MINDQYDYPTESKVNSFISVLQLHNENKLYKSSVMVTAGANQVAKNRFYHLFYLLKIQWEKRKLSGFWKIPKLRREPIVSSICGFITLLMG